jgi:hypothetical protein
MLRDGEARKGDAGWEGGSALLEARNIEDERKSLPPPNVPAKRQYIISQQQTGCCSSVKTESQMAKVERLFPFMPLVVVIACQELLDRLLVGDHIFSK